MQLNKKAIEILNGSKVDISIVLSYYSDNILLYKMSGQIDTYNSIDTSKAIKESINDNIVTKIIIDMENIRYMSSTGIGIFVELLQYTKDKKIKFFLINMQSKTEEVFKLLGFYSLFNILKDYSEIDIADIKMSIFPLVTKCPHCNAAVKLPKVGRFKCSSCSKIIAVDNEGNINKG